MVLPAEERRAMRPSGRECEAWVRANLIAPSARVDARYCSVACRMKAARERIRNENGLQSPDTVPPRKCYG
jgi:hypothetical protein